MAKPGKAGVIQERFVRPSLNDKSPSHSLKWLPNHGGLFCVYLTGAFVGWLDQRWTPA